MSVASPSRLVNAACTQAGSGGETLSGSTALGPGPALVQQVTKESVPGMTSFARLETMPLNNRNVFHESAGPNARPSTTAIAVASTQPRPHTATALGVLS